MISLNSNLKTDNKLSLKVNNKNIYNINCQTKNDVFFKGIKNVFNLDLAKSIKDIPKDANIFIYTAKSKVKVPEEINIRECILTDRGAPAWKRLFKDYDQHLMVIKNCNVEYAHGEFNEHNTMPWGGIHFNHSNVDQVENTKLIQAVNNSNIKLARNIHFAEVDQSSIENIECFQDLELKEGCNIGKAEALNIICRNGNNINDAKCIFFDAIPNSSNPDSYTTINTIDIANRADISQAQINNMKGNIAIIKDSIIGKMDFDAIYRLTNTKADEVNVNSLCQANNCKIGKLKIAENYCNSILKGKIQIDELNLESAQANLFIFPKQEWGEKVNNYIKKINISQNKQSSKPYTPILRIQGDIDIEEINFVGQEGIVEFTTPPKPDNKLKIINGTARYNAKQVEIPSYLYDPFPAKY